MYLIDTNIFLEILLDQEKRKDCERFLNDNTDNISISDFSLHSIGVILFRAEQEDLFRIFIGDTLPSIDVLSLSQDALSQVVESKRKYKFDFDDAYQYSLAKNNNLQVVTMDKDFSALEESEVLFL